MPIEPSAAVPASSVPVAPTTVSVSVSVPPRPNPPVAPPPKVEPALAAAVRNGDIDRTGKGDGQLRFWSAATQFAERGKGAAKAAAGVFGRVVQAMRSDPVEVEKRDAILNADLKRYARDLAASGEAARYGRSEAFVAEMERRWVFRGDRPAIIDELDDIMKKRGGSGWYHSLIPYEWARLTGFLRNFALERYFKLAKLTLSDKPDIFSTWNRATELDAEKRAHFDQQTRYLFDEIRGREAGLASCARKGKLLFQERPPRRALQALSATYGIRGSEQCLRAVELILDWMMPLRVAPYWGDASNLWLSLRKQTADFITNVDNLRAVERLASKMWDWVSSEQVPDTDIMTALKNEYLGLGFAEPEATERAWEFLGVYATRGANIGETIGHYAHGGLRGCTGCFAVIAHGMGVLDERALRHEKPMFSYPRDVATTLDNSKPYHFWMSAYLARRASQSVGSTDAGMHGAWIAQIGYQMRAKTDGRDPTRAFRIGSFDPPNNKIRVDLAYAAAGVTYGVRTLNGGKAPRLDVDEGFRRLVQAGKPLSRVTDAEAKSLWEGNGAEGFVRWSWMFRPQAALDFFTAAR